VYFSAGLRAVLPVEDDERSGIHPRDVGPRRFAKLGGPTVTRSNFLGLAHGQTQLLGDRRLGVGVNPNAADHHVRRVLVRTTEKGLELFCKANPMFQLTSGQQDHRCGPKIAWARQESYAEIGRSVVARHPLSFSGRGARRGPTHAAAISRTRHGFGLSDGGRSTNSESTPFGMSPSLPSQQHFAAGSWIHVRCRGWLGELIDCGALRARAGRARDARNASH
jgi:hypothetical protein